MAEIWQTSDLSLRSLRAGRLATDPETAQSVTLTTRPARFELATSRSGGAWMGEWFEHESRMIAKDSADERQ